MKKYEIDITEKNCTLQGDNDKQIYTPSKLYVNESNKDRWLMRIKHAGINCYTITEIIEPVQNIDIIKPVKREAPLRPSIISKIKKGI